MKMRAVACVAALLLAAQVCGCVAEPEVLVDAYTVVDLNGNNWYASNSNASVVIPGNVPGEIHTDLYRAKKIGEPYYRFNDVDLRWVAYENWTYTLIFSVESDVVEQYSRMWLVADGLDTVANVSLNGMRAFTADNMYRRHVWDVTGHVMASTNTLQIKFLSAISAANASAAIGFDGEPSLGTPPNCPPPVQQGFCHVNFLRKSPCSFSWDWGPAFATQGIWRNISLVMAQDVPLLLDVAATPTLVKGGGAGGTVADDGTDVWNATATLRFQLASSSSTSKPAPIKVTVSLLTLDGVSIESTSQLVSLDAFGMTNVTVAGITGLKTWWPNGYGDQPLYRLQAVVHALTENSATPNVTTQQRNTTMGFRTVRLVQDPLPGGKSFEFHINDVAVFIKGANWVPADAFESRVTSARLERLLTSLRDANMNAVRNWGGGIYQRDEFYDICDRLGLLVWEEFMFACSTYPTDKGFLNNVQEEVVDNMLRIMSHPSVFLWSTNNENEVAIAQSWYGTRSETKQFSALYADLYFGTVLSQVAAIDTSRPRLSSSPSDGNETIQDPISYNPQSNFYGDVHYYNYNADCWDVTTYPRPRFASEFGVQSYPSLITLKPVSDASLGDWSSINSPFMQHRQHHPNGNEEMINQMKKHFIVPNNTDSTTRFQNTIHMTQVVQAVCMKTEAEHYRRLRSQGNATASGFTMGTLYWQANEIWQGASWASQDYTGRWKMLHYYAKQFYAPTIISGYLQGGNMSLWLVNDQQAAVSGQVEIELVSWKTGVASSWAVLASVDAGSSALAFTEPLTKTLGRGDCPSASSCVLQYAFLSLAGDVIHRNYLFLGDFQDMSVLEPPALVVESVVAGTGSTFNVTVSAAAVAPLVWLESTYQGVWSDNGFLMVASQLVVVFTSWDSAVTADALQKSITVTSLYDMYTFPTASPLGN